MQKRKLKSLLEKIASYKVLVVGDAITDEYHYVEPLGKASKDPIIATRFKAHEHFSGGVWAAADHVKQFCAKVDVLTGPTMTTKRRFVDKNYLRKLFEVQYSRPTSRPRVDSFDSYDLVIVTDFGHGCVTPDLIEQLLSESRFLAVNAQTNSANYGFNLITKYPRADYVVIDEPEAWLAANDRDSDIDTVIEKLGFGHIIVTQGPKGCTGYDGASFVNVPSKATKIVDTMGAGDAFLAVTAPFACAGVAIGDLCDIGNAAGAVKCSAVGQQAVTKQALRSALEVR